MALREKICSLQRDVPLPQSTKRSKLSGVRGEPGYSEEIWVAKALPVNLVSPGSEIHVTKSAAATRLCLAPIGDSGFLHQLPQGAKGVIIPVIQPICTTTVWGNDPTDG